MNLKPTFTEEEVLGFTNTIKELELKDSLNVSCNGFGITIKTF